MLISIETHRACDFPGGGVPSGSMHGCGYSKHMSTQNMFKLIKENNHNFTLKNFA